MRHLVFTYRKSALRFEEQFFAALGFKTGLSKFWTRKRDNCDLVW